MPAVRCLVVDDEVMLRRVLVRVLTAAGYEVVEAGSGIEALDRLGRTPIELVISDIHMPGMDGMQLLAQVRALWPDIGVVMITAVTDVQTAVACLNQGALDYVSKPFQVDEVLARVRQALERRRLVLENRGYQRTLEQRVRQQADRIRDLFVLGVQTLAHALEAKDPYTRGHSMRVAAYGTAIAAQLGLDPETIAEVRLGAELHDVGKIGVREAVLLKPNALDEQEYLHIMQHTLIGERILQPLLQDHPLVLQIVRSHHERLDGHGFPDRLAGEHIGLAVRIVTVSDTFDAMTTARPYRIARDTASAVGELVRCAGAQFDPAVVDAFRRAFPNPALLSAAAGGGAALSGATSLVS
jgi:response regulator RpfG family c-di-GMP phosphodiesterase